MKGKALKKAAVMVSTGILLLGTASLTGADEITDTIQEALDQYRRGEFAGAAGSLDYAAQLMRQKKGESLQSLLPDALPGWTAKKATSDAIGTAMLGGGVTAKREYARNHSSVTVEIVTDSPLLQSIMMMFTNPMFATAGGGKLEKIAGQRAIVEYDPAGRSGKVSIVVANRFLVIVQGNGVAKKEIAGYAAGIDYARLASLP